MQYRVLTSKEFSGYTPAVFLSLTSSVTIFVILISSLSAQNPAAAWLRHLQLPIGGWMAASAALGVLVTTVLHFAVHSARLLLRRRRHTLAMQHSEPSPSWAPMSDPTPLTLKVGGDDAIAASARATA